MGIIWKYQIWKEMGNNSWIVNGISMEHWQKIVVFLALWQWNMAGKYTRFRSMIFPWFSQHFSIGFCQLFPWSPVLPVWKSSARISRIVSLVSSKNHHHWSNSWLSDKLFMYIYNDSSALVTSSSASIPPRIMVIQCDSTSTRFCSLFAVETTNNQPTYLNTPVTLPWAFHQLVKMWLCLKGVARCDFFVRCHQIYLRVTLW